MDQKQVEHIAILARLGLTVEEKEAFSGQLSQIFSYIEKLNELDTSNVEPTSHVLSLSNVFREDEVKPSLPSEKVVGNAPDREAFFFKVPKIIE